MDEHTWSVSALVAAVADVVRASFPDQLWVEGEITSLNRARSGHVYFDLSHAGPPDAPGQRAAVLPVVLFARERQRVNAALAASAAVRMTDGVRVRICGRVAVWAPGGRLQLQMTGIDPIYTVGQMAAEREQVLRALADEGLLRANATHELPVLPLEVGLVTSAASAACADVLAVLRRSGLGFRVALCDAPTQGPDAPALLAAAIDRLERSDVEVIAVVRGGGARTDLVAFDAEVLARRIATSTLPVVVGIGHEVDRTVADEVANRSCATPTACASLLVDRARASVAHVGSLAVRVADQATRSLTRADERVVAVAERTSGVGRDRLARSDERLVATTVLVDRAIRRSTATASAELDRRHERLAQLADGALSVAERTVDGHRTRAVLGAERALSAQERRVELVQATARVLDPARLLERGWSVTRTGDGTLVRDPLEVAPGTVLRTTLAGGELTSVATEAEDAAQDPFGGES